MVARFCNILVAASVDSVSKHHNQRPRRRNQCIRMATGADGTGWRFINQNILTPGVASIFGTRTVKLRSDSSLFRLQCTVIEPRREQESVAIGCKIVQSL